MFSEDAPRWQTTPPFSEKRTSVQVSAGHKAMLSYGVCRLEEGRYMIGHKAGEPFVTIYKAAMGKKVSRGAYDLQQAHSRLPQPPTQGGVPWVPVDPANVQPFHKKHGRVPCTFPPQDLQKVRWSTNPPSTCYMLLSD